MSEQSPEAQIEDIKKIVREYGERFNHGFAGDLPWAVRQLLRLAEYTATDSLAAVKTFRDDTLSWLRALSMCVEMAGNGGTHAEKAARLRGMSELIDTAIGKLRDQKFDFDSQRYNWPDLYRSEYPVRRYLERAHRAEQQAKEATKVAKRYEIALSLVSETNRAYFEAALADAEKKLEGEKEFDPNNGREMW